MIHSPFAPKYKSGEQITVSTMTFFRRLVGEVGQLFDTFNWEGIFIAGGFMSGLMEVKYDPQVYNDSDIDMYICGATTAQLRERIKYVVNYLQTKTPNVYFLLCGHPDGFLIDCMIQGWRRRLQLIGVTFASPFRVIKDFKKSNICPTPMEIISAFDLTHCQIAFNGTEVICTPEFIQAMMRRQTSINPQISSIHAYRLIKAYLRGYSIGQPTHELFIKNYYRRTYEEPCHPHTGTLFRTDRLWRSFALAEEFEELLHNPIVQQNLHKNFMVDFEQMTSKQRLEAIKEQFNDMTRDMVVYNRYGYMILKHLLVQGKYLEADDQISEPIENTTTLMDHISHMSCANQVTV